MLLSSPEMLRFRKEVLGKSKEQPDLVVVTATGSFDVKHPVWTVKNRKKLIATSTQGLAHLEESLAKQLDTEQGYASGDGAKWLSEHEITVKEYVDDSNAAAVNFVELMRFLKNEWDVQFADISAGPTLISLMMKAYVRDKLLRPLILQFTRY